jgi:hypothetical protein
MEGDCRSAAGVGFNANGASGNGNGNGNGGGGGGGSGGGGTCADDDDDAGAGFGPLGPAKALAAAHEQESARVTLYRAIKTVFVMLEARGFECVGNQADILQEFETPRRAAEAEQQNEVLFEAVVPDAPARYTSAWALGLPAGTRMLVVVVSVTNVGMMRDIVADMGSGTDKAQYAIVLHRSELTPFSRKFLAELDATTHVVEPFLMAALQAPINKSRLTPRHVPLNAQYAAVVRKRYPTGHFPRLLTSDAMIRFLGLPRDTLVMVRECVGREQAIITFFVVTCV